MALLSASETKKQIANELAASHDNLQIISAFCKKSAMEFLDSCISADVTTKQLLVRFTLEDVVKGVTDVDLFEYCKEHGWQMFIRFDLHAKTYVFDRKRGIVGSSNMTGKGLGLNPYCNSEFDVLTDLDADDMKKIDRLFASAIHMSEDLYGKLLFEYEKAKADCPSRSKVMWSKEVEDLFQPSVDTLFTYDFPSFPQPVPERLETWEFLPLSSPESLEEIKNAFRWSKAYLWLKQYLLSCSEHEAYFGAITAALHNDLVNDPKPYRKEVKDLLANTLGWIEFLGCDEMVVDVPGRHSQRVRIA